MSEKISLDSSDIKSKHISEHLVITRFFRSFALEYKGCLPE